MSANPVSFDPAARWAPAPDEPLLTDRVRELLRTVFSLEEQPAGGEPPSLGELPASRLPGAAREALVSAVGTDHVRDDEEARRTHANGMSYLDLLRRRTGQAPPPPDAIVAPAGEAEIAGVLAACVEHGIAVVPFGGGTSVVGGVGAGRGSFAAVVALDLARLDQLVAVDTVSRTATLQAGLTGPRAEALLEPHGLTLGHVPQSYERATIGGYAATRSAGQLSTGWGRFDDLVEHLRAVTPAGSLDLGRAPGSAAGPDLRQLLLGSEGAFGVITEVTVRVRPIPEVRHHEGWRVADLSAGLDLLRTLAQDGPRPDLARLSDETETALGVATGGGEGTPGGCLLLCGWEGSATDVASRRAATTAVLEAAGAESLGTGPGEAWRHGRFRSPSLRDELLGVGVLVETLETACSWRDVLTIHHAVGEALRGALDGASPVVSCHVSHLYAAGASLYFTVLGRRDETDPVAQWQGAKRAAADAMTGAGATITHHHAVGADHAPWMAAEVGELGVDLLRTVKARLDPTGILNPGKLLA